MLLFMVMPALFGGFGNCIQLAYYSTLYHTSYVKDVHTPEDTHTGDY